jgi:hypothetical protein
VEDSRRVGDPKKKKLRKKAKKRQRDSVADALDESGHHKREKNEKGKRKA